MFYLSESRKRYYRYVGLLAVVVLGVVSILGTGGGGDSTPPPPPAPSIISVFPSSLDSALVTTEITARFSESMDPLTINANSFQLRDSGLNPITGSVDFYTQYGGYDYVAVFVPDVDLDVAEEYFATLTTEITNTSGDPLARDYNWSFLISPAIIPVSTNETGAVGTNYDGADDSSINATGEYIVFVSKENLAGQATNGIAQIYRKNTITGKIEIVSLNDNGILANADCASPRISDTGRYVVFASKANNLDLNFVDQSKYHIYLKDLKLGISDTITLLDVNKDDSTQPANGSSNMPDISGIPDVGSGKYVVFESTAPDLQTNDTDTISDIFLINIASGNVELISVDSNEVKGNAASFAPRVSDNGQRVVFESIANNLATSDPNTTSDIFLRDLNSTADPLNPTITTHISISPTDGAANEASNNPDISGNGNYVVFQSVANNLVSSDTNSKTDIFLRDLVNATTSRLSLKSDGAQTLSGDSTTPAINIDGSYVTFVSTANDLVSTDPNVTVADVFARNTVDADSIVLLSVPVPPLTNNQASTRAAISADGRYVSFTTPNKFTDLDNNGRDDIYRAYNEALP